MSKHQTGLRIDRILFKQFQQICATEKLRPGEAVESLIRVAVEAKSVTSVNLERVKQESTVRMFDDALFRSRLSRLKKSIELEERYWKERGQLPDEQESEYYVNELTELGRRSVSPELVKEFEAILSTADKLYADSENNRMQREINDRIGRDVAAE